MFWYLNDRWLILASVVLYLFCYGSTIAKHVVKKSELVVALIFFALFIFITNYQATRFLNASILSYSRSFLMLFLLILVAITDKLYAKEALFFIAKSLAGILLVSMVVHILIMFVELPFIPTPYITSEGEMPYGIFSNYIVLIKSNVDEGMIRFQGPFLEPGQLGTLLAFLLFILEYDFKEKWRLILLVALIMTFSLAGYVLGVFGFIMVKVKNVRRALLYGILLFSIIALGRTINDGKNAFNELILSRLELDEEKGIVGNNRNTQQVDVLFEETISDPSALLFGTRYRSDLDQLAGTGYKNYIIAGGIFPLLFLLLFFLFSYQAAVNKRFVATFFLLYTASFFQRPQVEQVHLYLLFLYCLNMDQGLLKVNYKSKREHRISEKVLV